MRYELRLSAPSLEILPLVAVADAVARAAATAGGTPFHRPAYRGKLGNIAAWIVDDARKGRVTITDQDGRPGSFDELIQRAKDDGSYSEVLRAPDSTEIDLIITQAMCIYTTLRSLNKWASERGDEFAISQVGWIDERGLIEPKGSACVAVIINGREAIPVRAIPYVTGWDVSPDRLAKSLAHTPGGVRLDRLAAYHADGERGPILPKEWDGIVDRLKGLAASLEVENSNREITRPQWLKKSIPILPAGVFVWKDELEKSFSRFSAETGTLEGDRPDDGKLNFSPLIPGRMREKVMKGFVKDAAPKQADDAAIERSRVPAVTEIAPPTDTSPRVPDEAQEQTGTACSEAPEKAAPEAEILRKRSALIAEFEGMWPTIANDLYEGSDNGLSEAARTKKYGIWNVCEALKWSVVQGKIHPEKAEAFVQAEGDSDLSFFISGLLKQGRK